MRRRAKVTTNKSFEDIEWSRTKHILHHNSVRYIFKEKHANSITWNQVATTMKTWFKSQISNQITTLGKTYLKHSYQNWRQCLLTQFFGESYQITVRFYTNLPKLVNPTNHQWVRLKTMESNIGSSNC